jgi:hypothetical protein
MTQETQPQEPEVTPSPGGEGDDEDLATLAGGFTNDEPKSDPEPEDEPEKAAPTESDLADDAVPDEDSPAGDEPLELSEDLEIPLDNGETISLGEAKKLAQMYKGSKDTQAMRGAYLRAREELANERKQFDAERAPLAKAHQQLTNMQHAFEADPVAYGLHALKLGMQDGVVDQGLVEAVQSIIEEYAQSGKYNPHALKARAAEMQARRQSEQVEQEQRRIGFERELWTLQGSVGRIFTEEDRTMLRNAWNHLAVTTGRRPSLDDAWKLVQQTAQKPSSKPVARPSPTKVVQQLRKPKKATTERAGGSGRSAGYNKNDLDRDLDFIARM